jgi:hypothetical protein
VTRWELRALVRSATAVAVAAAGSIASTLLAALGRDTARAHGAPSGPFACSISALSAFAIAAILTLVERRGRPPLAACSLLAAVAAVPSLVVTLRAAAGARDLTSGQAPDALPVTLLTLGGAAVAGGRVAGALRSRSWRAALERAASVARRRAARGKDADGNRSRHPVGGR